MHNLLPRGPKNLTQNSLSPPRMVTSCLLSILKKVNKKLEWALTQLILKLNKTKNKWEKRNSALTIWWRQCPCVSFLRLEKTFFLSLVIIRSFYSNRWINWTNESVQLLALKFNFLLFFFPLKKNFSSFFVVVHFLLQ